MNFVISLGLILVSCFACTEKDSSIDANNNGGAGGQEPGGGTTDVGGSGTGGTRSESSKPTYCAHENVLYLIDQTVSEESIGDDSMGEKLRTCVCDETGEVTCDTERVSDPDPDGREPDCYYNDKSYYSGNTFTATDGCNTCECVETDKVTCTTEDCGCDRASESSRTYLSPTVTRCTTAIITCVDGYSSFVNACGCGCEPSAT
jgi:hypothetical protein